MSCAQDVFLISVGDILLQKVQNFIVWNRLFSVSLVKMVKSQKHCPSSRCNSEIEKGAYCEFQESQGCLKAANLGFTCKISRKYSYS